MNITEVQSLDQKELLPYSKLTEAQLRNGSESFDGGVFIVESPKVIKVAIESGYKPLSLLCERKHIDGDAADIISQFPDLPIFTGSREILKNLTGYTLTRGVLCAMKREQSRTVKEICQEAQRVVVIQGVVDTTNIGAIFRSAAALGIDAVLLTKDSCDPLNRRSIRVSMGSVFLIPWTWIDTSLEELKELGFKTAAMALSDNSISLDNPILMNEKKLAIIMGTEGDGLPKESIEAADFVVKIPMAHNVDSLNVAAAAAVAFWQLRVK